MKQSGPQILFVSHDALRTGAPILLLHFLRWFKLHTNVAFEILLRAGGDLQPDFEAIGPVSVLQPWARLTSSPVELARRMHNQLLLARLARSGVKLVYSNTVTNGGVLRTLARPGRTVITHVHELEARIRSLRPDDFAGVLAHTHRYIACSQAVKANLVDRHRIDGAAVEVIHEFIQMPSGTADSRKRDAVRATLGVPPGALVVGAVGTTDWRKAPDLFIQLAAAVCRRRPGLPVHFVWVGGAVAGSPAFDALAHDIRGAQLDSQIHFLGEQSSMLDYFRAFDVFALTSREDPFPLVCLEAAAVGVPIVCFDGAGGEKEFVEEDCGYVVPYLDVQAMAESTIALLESEGLRRRLGERAAEKVRSRHEVTVTAPKILAAMKQSLPTRDALATGW
jgi:glycosyltransferase involved in cell wall biosynthesis